MKDESRSMAGEKMGNDPLIGSALGGYLIEGVVGRGGMGVVYRARDAAGVTVAVKVIAPELLTSEDARRRFSREAQYARSLDHPAILPILGTGEADGVLFLVMPLVEGPDLKSLVLDGPLETQRLLSIVSRVAEALDVAHEAGLVHRDVKPQNILLEGVPARGKKEKIWLTDFGLVRHMSALTSSTRTGQFLGSVEYVAPEQIAGRVVDGRADVYSLACVAFECLTGSIPFPREMHVAALWAHMKDDAPRATMFRPDLPSAVDDIFHTGLAKAPEDRYLTCGELAEELRRELHEHRGVAKVAAGVAAQLESEWSKPPPGPPVMRERRVDKPVRPRLGIALGAAALSLLFGLAIGTNRGREVIGNAAGAVTDAAEAVVQDVTGEDGPRAGSLEARRPSNNRAPKEDGRPPGSTRGYAVPDRSARDRVAAPGVAAGPLRDAPGTPVLGASGAPIEPKIIWIISKKNFAEGSDIWMMDPDGGGRQRLTFTAADEHWPVFSPDGTRIAFERSGDIWVMRSDGTDERRVADCPARQKPDDPTVYEEFCGEPEWSPDGNSVAFIRGSWAIYNGWMQGDLYLVTARGSAAARLVARAGDTPLGSPSWPPGNRITVGCNPPGDYNSGICLVHPATGRVDEIYRGGDFETLYIFNPMSSPADTNRVLVEGLKTPAQMMQIWMMTRDGRHARHVHQARFGSYDPVWAPDGIGIVFSCWQEAYTGDICRMGPRGENPHEVFDSGFNDIQPDWWIPRA